MSVDYQQVQQQIQQMGESAPAYYRELQARHQQAAEALRGNAGHLDAIRDKLGQALHFNRNLRTGLPFEESLDARFPSPAQPDQATLLAADGSQINPDRHASVDYCLVNVGAIEMVHGSPAAPRSHLRTQLLYDDAMYTENGRITEGLVALMRDLAEREVLAELATGLSAPVFTLTDGPLELWGGREGSQEGRIFEEKFGAYLEALHRLKDLGAATAGYIDRPRSDLLVRLLEIAVLEEHELNKAGKEHRPFRGITDISLFQESLGLYERSAILGIQSPNSRRYQDELELFFFYLNVGNTSEGHASLARVEIPGWVAKSPRMVDDLHALLVNQCQIMGPRAYPYLLHRSHEVAVVTQDEKRQIENMIVLELRRRVLQPSGISNKQSAKDVSRRR
jgi:hypothetical protein